MWHTFVARDHLSSGFPPTLVASQLSSGLVQLPEQHRVQAARLEQDLGGARDHGNGHLLRAATALPDQAAPESAQVAEEGTITFARPCAAPASMQGVLSARSLSCSKRPASDSARARFPRPSLSS